MQEAPNKPGGQASTNPLRKRRKMHLWGKPEKYLAKHFNRMQTSWKERQTREKSLCLMLLPQTSLPFICTVFFIAKIAHHLLFCRRFWSPFHQAIFCTKVPWFESVIIPTFFGRQILHPWACMAWAGHPMNGMSKKELKHQHPKNGWNLTLLRGVVLMFPAAAYHISHEKSLVYRTMNFDTMIMNLRGHSLPLTVPNFQVNLCHVLLKHFLGFLDNLWFSCKVTPASELQYWATQRCLAGYNVPFFSW